MNGRTNSKNKIKGEIIKKNSLNLQKYSIFDDLLIGNFMKTRLHNLSSLYDPIINFNNVFKIQSN